ncbi:MAG TPA: hypothetical protein VNE62_02320 [Actinomycetota bacterium]|nr:hypothetical protein [Actinomycetota bacterium]
MPNSSFKLLYVCTGVEARSSIAEACTKACVNGGPTWHITSAGTGSVEGAPPPVSTVELGKTLGVDMAGQQLKSLSAQLCESSDLILAMSWEQVSDVWSLVPHAWGRCFTLKEFVHWAKQTPTRPSILFADDSDRMRWTVSQAHDLRRKARSDHGFWAGLRPEDFEMADPAGRDGSAWQNYAKAVKVLVTDAVRLVEGK